VLNTFKRVLPPQQACVLGKVALVSGFKVMGGSCGGNTNPMVVCVADTQTDISDRSLAPSDAVNDLVSHWARVRVSTTQGPAKVFDKET
jgi:hypothetical protein